VKRYYLFFTLILLLFALQRSMAQKSKQAITYEELYDDPYAINKLYVHLQPLYGELFKTNVTVGFGAAVNYYYEDKFNLHAHYRQAYFKSFDLARDVALKNQEIENRPDNFNFFEVGGTYHIKDLEADTETKLVLYSKKYQKGNRWAAKVPEHTVVPSKVRKIIGGRLGGLGYNTSSDLNNIMKDQGVVLVDQDSVPMPADVYVNGNMSVFGGFLGGSMSWIKNMAIKPDKGYGVLSDDQILTVFFDILIAPSISFDDIEYKDPAEDYRTRVFSADPVKTSMIGVRAGLEGKYNRELGWSYGIETGIRPGIKGRGFYAAFKVSFPVYSTNLDYEREAFGK